jgi:UDP-glucose 4-epimerase
MSKNILMPGGIGYIGSHATVQLLLETNHNLTIVDNYLNCSIENLARIFESAAHDLPENTDINPYKQGLNFY